MPLLPTGIYRTVLYGPLKSRALSSSSLLPSSSLLLLLFLSLSLLFSLLLPLFLSFLFFFLLQDVDLDRADIRIDPSTNAKSTGLPLHMKFQVFQLGREECIPLSSTRVDLWQCDIAGRYSAFWDQGEDLTKERFLRGYQMTDESGVARFTTIYPGWYQGRTTHLHFKIRTEVVGNRGYEFTSQLYFDDKVTDEVHSQSPYREYGVRRTRNSNDLIFRRSGEQLILELHPIEIGYETTFSIGLDLSMVG